MRLPYEKHVKYLNLIKVKQQQPHKTMTASVDKTLQTKI